MKYPNILFFRYNKYNEIDSFFEINKDKLLCNINIVNNKTSLNKLFNIDYHLLITFGEKEDEYINDVNNIIVNRIRFRWFHLKVIDNIDTFNQSVNYCYMKNITKLLQDSRPIFSIFTTCYNSYDKILRAYNSLLSQTFKDWEWIILDDSPDDNHFLYIKEKFKDENKIRLYKRSQNSGSIGNVKNEAVSLCRGKYLLELDHDDEILSYVLEDSVKVFDENNDIGFIYMDYTNIYEKDNKNFKYGNYFSLGYAGYYRQKYKDNWVYVASTPNINNITLSHIVSVPNHPRIWRKDVLLKIGNYSEFLPISDDYELILRTAVNTKIAKIHKLGYIQYMNDNENNFSLIRNSEINRLRHHLTKHCYEDYKVNEHMKEADAFEEECLNEKKPIWKRDKFIHKYYNQIINLNYKKQICIIGLKTLYNNFYKIKQLYFNNNNNNQIDFIVLDNKINNDALCKIMDSLDFYKFKCFSIDDCTEDELINYFHLIYKSCNDYHIIKEGIKSPIMIEDEDEDEIKEIKDNIDIKKKLTIITPSIRPENLLKIKESINFDYINEWIIVYDGKKITENPKLFTDNNKIKEYIYTFNGTGEVCGHAQRNFALDNIIIEDTYIYYLDDDNILHPDLYSLLDNIENNKIYTFDQKRPKDVFPYKEYLQGNNVELFAIDTAMFLVDFKLCKNIRWNPYKYYADGIYIMECYSLNINNWCYINKLMAYYNYL